MIYAGSYRVTWTTCGTVEELRVYRIVGPGDVTRYAERLFPFDVDKREAEKTALPEMVAWLDSKEAGS